MMNQDPYFKLRPPQPTPADEICRCLQAKPIKLMSALVFNPVYCMDCNREVPPEVLGISPALVEAIAVWRSVYDAIDRLWLDSGEYEQWARNELANIHSPVNMRGREVQRQLNEIRLCYYWYFQDQSDPNYKPMAHCPACGSKLSKYKQGKLEQLICEPCQIVTSGD